MKKEILATIGVLALGMSMSMAPISNVKAAEAETVIVDERAIQPRGTYLQKGVSSIGEIGTGKIKAGGTTIAQRVVSEIKLSVIVERKVKGNWARYTSWNVSDSNTYTLTSSKTLTVPRGYSYRVRCIHSANTDNSSSNTNALYVD